MQQFALRLENLLWYSYWMLYEKDELAKEGYESQIFSCGIVLCWCINCLLIEHSYLDSLIL